MDIIKVSEKDAKGKRNKDDESTCGRIVCERLKKLREQRDMTQQELSDATGLHVQSISRFERLPCKTGTDTLVILARFFDVPCGYLIGEDKIALSDQLQVQPEFVAQTARFVELICANQVHNPTELLKVFSALLEANPDKLVDVRCRMIDEEHAFGLWWSALAAYEQGEWDSMIARAEQLKELGERLGRPFLTAIGRVYIAQALCRRERDVDLERALLELGKVPQDSTLFESSIIPRLIAKVFRRIKNNLEALKLCEKAEQVMNNNRRDDALYRFEKVKLLRYIGVLHSRLVNQIDAPEKTEFEEHMKKADEYFDKCESAIKDLEKELPREGAVESMLLAFAKALHFELNGKLEESRKSAERAFDLATNNAEYAKRALNLNRKKGEDTYSAKVKMFLVHICILLVEPDNASRHLAYLMPLSRFQSGPLKGQYEKWIVPHKKDISQLV